MKEYENELYKKGFSLVAGVDEVGRGPLYGPVVSACVVMPKDFYNKEVNDSKKLTEKKREELFEVIKENATSIGLGVVDSSRIDEINIYEATKESMYMAINEAKKSTTIEHILIDAMKLELDIPSTSIIKGDSKSQSIACASIVAKVTRDRMLIDESRKYPEYDFENNKGYGTKKHLAAIKEYGILENHRVTYAPVKEKIEN